MGVRTEDYPGFLRALFQATNVDGALITMPHKAATLGLVDEVSASARIAGACNAVRKRPGGSLFGDLFDGSGFIAALHHRDFAFPGAACYVLGAGGVGRAISGALAAEGVASIRVVDADERAERDVGERISSQFPGVAIRTGASSLAGHTLVVNATPLGSRSHDDVPFDLDALAPAMLVADVVMATHPTPLMVGAAERGCTVQPGIDMLFAQIPLYLEFFGFGRPGEDELRKVARL